MCSSHYNSFFLSVVKLNADTESITSNHYNRLIRYFNFKEIPFVILVH